MRIGLALGFIGSLVLAPLNARIPWWNPQFRYRVRVTVHSGFYRRTDYLVRQPLDFAPSLKIAEGSLRVVEWDAARRSAREVPSQIGVGVNGERALCWQMAGTTPTLTERVFYLYFDTRPGPPRPSYPPVPGADQPPPGNLLRNPGFEEADPQNPALPNHWQPVGGPEVGESVRTDEFAHSGRFSLKVTNRQGGETSIGLGQWVDGLKPGASYLLRGWVKITEFQSGGAGLTVWYTPAPGQTLPGNNKTQAGGGGITDWIPLVATGVIYHDPARGYSITVEKTLPGTAGGRVEATCWYGQLTAYFDGLELLERHRDAFAPCEVTVGPVEQRPTEGRWRRRRNGEWRDPIALETSKGAKSTATDAP